MVDDGARHHRGRVLIRVGTVLVNAQTVPSHFGFYRRV